MSRRRRVSDKCVATEEEEAAAEPRFNNMSTEDRYFYDDILANRRVLLGCVIQEMCF